MLRIETDRYHAAIATEGYVSGVMAGSFVDKQTGAWDLSFGLEIVDFLLEPGPEDEATPQDLHYHVGDAYHGNLVKRYVELPQICTQAKTLPFEIVQGQGFVAVKQWFRWSVAPPPYKVGSLWEQWLVFPDGARWFLAYDKVTSANTTDRLLLRMDMPGHLKHQGGDTFDQVYLSYCGNIPSAEFVEDAPPHAKCLYEREEGNVPERFIRAYQLRNGVWLAGMALEPAAVYESWCHQRGYVCFIHEIGGWPVREGESFGAVNLIGYFDDLAEMEETFDAYKGTKALTVTGEAWR